MNSQEVRVSKHKSGNWRAARYLVIALAFGGWFTGTALAQSAIRNRASKSATADPADPPAANSADPAQAGGQAAPAVGVNSGNYNFQGSVSLGWRYNDITGSEANYDTFVNLQQGPRLLNFSLNAHSLNHNGALFDNMSIAGFGFGGDPVDVVRLNMTKDKWYNFNATYRRYKYFWGYNLLANPLNTASSNPEVPITKAPHLMDLSHRMSDFQLKLLPQSAVHFRLGYTHSREVGPSYTTEGAAGAPISEPGAVALLGQNFKTTEDNYNAGLDFVGLTRTTLSYDQFVQHYKEDTYQNDANLIYTLSDGTPVDLGLVFMPGTPCSTPLIGGNVDPSCDANLSFHRGGRPRGTIPTERFSFQSTYIRNLNMTGQVSYSSGEQTVGDLFDNWTGYDARINSLGTNDTANTKAHQIIVNGDWNAVYDVTSKFRVMDSLNYNAFRIPGTYNFNVINYFPPANLDPLVAAENPTAYLFNPSTCPAPYTAPECPQHNSSSGPDSALGYRARYLGQKFFSNTFELAYDFTSKVGARIGYRHLYRKIDDQDTLVYTSEVFYPGGSAGAARGDCKSGCTAGPNGSLVFSGLTGDTSHGLITDINGNSALFGLWVRPASNFRTSFNLELFSADSAFTRITPRLMRHYQVNSTYTPVSWTSITGAIDIVDGSDDVYAVSNENHDRSYSLSTTFMPGSRFSYDLSYNYSDIYTQALDCYTVGFGPAPKGAASCPTYPDLSAVNVAAMSTYLSKTNFVSSDLMVKPVKQLTFTLGYAGSFVRGTPSWFNPFTTYSVNFLNSLTPWGPLRFNYQTPYVTMNWQVYKGLSYSASWNYYGYNSRGNNNPVGLAPLGTQDFNGNNMTMSAQYSF
jgi:hypothetical protein